MSNVSYINVNRHLYPFDDPQLTEEVENIRIGADGKQYGSAGDALRSQLADINDGLETAQNNITQIYGEQDDEKENVSQAQGDITTLQNDTSALATDISNANSGLAPAFSESTTYAIGDYCIYDGTLYEAVAEHTGAWNAADFETVSIGGELETANAETADAQEITQTVSERKMGALIDTASGSIASFVPDATVPTVRGLTVDVEPVQDLHGYNSPWPAGGGKNLMPPPTSVDVNGTDLRVTNQNGQLTINGSAHSGDSIIVGIKPTTINEGYILAFLNSFVGSTVYFLNGTTSVDYFSASTTNRVVNTSSMATLYGKTFNVYRILFSSDQTLTNASFALMAVADGADTTTFAPYSNICPISGWDAVEVKHSGADMTNPTTYTIPLGQTVYGGTVDVVTGVLTVNKVVVDLGTLSWNAGSTSVTGKYRFLASLPNSAVNSDTTVGVTSLCSQYVALATGGTFSTANNGYTINGSKIYIYDASHDTDNGTTFQNAMSGVQLVYELATPVTISLTPIEISVLTGQANNIWADSGNVSVEYAADLKTYIDQKIAAAVAALS